MNVSKQITELTAKSSRSYDSNQFLQTQLIQFGVLKPYHMSQFMCNDGGNPLLVGVGGELFIVEQCCLSVGDQTPVLHGSSIKIW